MVIKKEKSFKEVYKVKREISILNYKGRRKRLNSWVKRTKSKYKEKYQK